MKCFSAYLAVVVTAVMTMASCAGLKSTPVVSGSEKHDVPALPQISRNDSLRFKMFFIEAVKQQDSDNYDAAYDLLQRCLTINPNAAEVYYLLSPYDATLSGDSAAFRDLKKAAELSPRNNNYQESLARMYIRMKNYGDAVKTYEKVAQNTPDRADVLKILSMLYSQQKDYDHLVATLNRIEELEGSSEELTLNKMRAYSLQGKKDEEYAELKSLADKHPNDLNYRVMIGNWLLQNGKQQEAFDEYQNVLKEEPDNSMAMMSLIDYYNAAGLKHKADSLQEALLLSRKTPLENKVSIIQQIVSAEMKANSDSTNTLTLFKKILAQPQETADMDELYVAYMTYKNMPQDTITAAMNSALERFPDNAGIRLRLIGQLYNSGDYTRAAELARQGIDYTPDKIAFYYYLGYIYVQLDDDNAALDAFERGVAHITEEDDRKLGSDMYYFIARAYYERNDTKKAYEAFDNSLQMNSDNYGTLNDYAYYLSLQGEQLDKAEKMSYRVIQANPDNASYLDTYAWVLFKQKKYKEALPFIELAVKADTTCSSEVLEHCGDIYAMNGDIDKAVEYWTKAKKQSDGDTRVLIRKIKLMKYIDEK